jgi:hypothetical protein
LSFQENTIITWIRDIQENIIVQNYWLFGLFPSSGILGTRKHDVSETDPLSETSGVIVSRIPDEGKIPKTQ